MFINRKAELESLSRMYGSGRAELFVLYGRRRVGKTELLRAFCEGKPHLFFIATLSADGEQLSTFSQQIWSFTHAESMPGFSFPSWEEAFRALANLPGKTLAISTEQPDTFIAATDILNLIISGEKITIEQKFKAAYDITPRVKLAWAMNDLPRVNGANNGIMRRVKVVKFPALAAAERDPDVKERVKTEGMGILNWALDGLARLHKRGRFIIPKGVEEATQEFENNNDVPALFLDDVGAMIGPQHRTAGSDLYLKYSEWCIKNGHKPQSSTSIATDWRRLGFEKKRINGHTFWEGVGF